MSKKLTLVLVEGKFKYKMQMKRIVVKIEVHLTKRNECKQYGLYLIEMCCFDFETLIVYIIVSTSYRFSLVLIGSILANVLVRFLL